MAKDKSPALDLIEQIKANKRAIKSLREQRSESDRKINELQHEQGAMNEALAKELDG